MLKFHGFSPMTASWITQGLLVAALSPALAEPPLVFRSADRQVHLLELYSSEGCSSCPPADAWLAGLRTDARLWKGFVPIEFHVDYWNRLGWTDRFSKAAFTGRQQGYAQEWGEQSVYTPGLVLDGREAARPAFDPGEKPGPEVGRLEVRRLAGWRFQVRFIPTAALRASGRAWLVHGALLGNGLESRVSAGENSGRVLKHEFVVLTLRSGSLKPAGAALTGEVTLEAPAGADGAVRAQSLSGAFWVSQGQSRAPVQAVGGDLTRPGDE